MSTIKELEEVEPDYSGNLGLLIELSENLQKDVSYTTLCSVCSS